MTITISSTEQYDLNFLKNDTSTGGKDSPLMSVRGSIYRRRTEGRFSRTRSVPGRPERVPGSVEYAIWLTRVGGEKIFMGIIRKRYAREQNSSWSRPPYIRESGYTVWEMRLTLACVARFKASHRTMGWRSAFATLADAKQCAATLVKREGITDAWTATEWADYRLCRILGCPSIDALKSFPPDTVRDAYAAI